MRVTILHNYYQQAGGEDQVFANESNLLENHGHEVYRYTMHNDRIQNMNRLLLTKNTIWNNHTYRELRSLFRQKNTQIAHFHNTFPLISPAAYYAAKDEGVAVVQTLHNYRLLCPNAAFFRDDNICEECLGKTVPWPGIVHACYRNSRAATAVITATLSFHRALATWQKMVDVYIALTEFAKLKFIAGGLPANKIIVKPNFVNPDPGEGNQSGEYALFVGRLTPEKGISTLISAWEKLQGKIPLKIAGDGPLSHIVAQATQKIPQVEWLGRIPLPQVYSLMKEATFLVFPSEWYEGLPCTIIEAFATGTPVIAANIGAAQSLVEPDRTGWLYTPGNPADLAAKVTYALTHRAKLLQMHTIARNEFESKYTAEPNYQKLIEIYNIALNK